MIATKTLTYDIETAGTIWPGDALMWRCRNVVVSPKLASSGNSDRTPLRMEVLRQFALSPKVSFKFVIGSEQDAVEAVTLLRDLGRVFYSKSYFMPLGATQAELLMTSPVAHKLANDYGVEYTPRRHIELYGTRRGI